jgi:hypothetical protein
MSQKVLALQDDSGHWYVIPAELESEFNKLVDCDEDDYELQNEFMERFDTRTSTIKRRKKKTSNSN